MNFIINNATIIDKYSPNNGKVCNLLIQDGLIKEISYKKITSNTNISVLDIEGKMLSAGWVDMNVSCTETGNYWDETIDSLLLAACNGGFTEIALMPNTNPIMDNANVLVNLKSYVNNMHSIIDIHFIGALTKSLKGIELADLYDMSKNGIAAFSNGLNWVQDSNLMLQALKYSKMLNKPVISIAQDCSLSNRPVVNESVNTLQLGLKGTPYISESIAIYRDLELIKYTGAQFHFSCISTKESVNILKEAKNNNIQITADTTSFHIYLDDTYLNTFDTNYKVNPPLRSAQDVTALKKGLKTNIINALVSQHTPITAEKKILEFALAFYGINNIESSFSCINGSLLNYMDISDIIAKITHEPRKILNLKPVSITEGSKATITMFDIGHEYKFDDDNIKSNAQNNPFIGKIMKGRPIAIVNNNKIAVTDENYKLR